jgi:hypothetical protein
VLLLEYLNNGSYLAPALYTSLTPASEPEEDHAPGIPVLEGHEDLVTSSLRSPELHRRIVGEYKTKKCGDFYRHTMTLAKRPRLMYHLCKYKIINSLCSIMHLMYSGRVAAK